MLSYLLYPLVGGVIGYITNDIAIRMLFRPRREKRLLGHRLPFTPGLIPKEKGRIARAVAEVISDNLMNREVLERYLTSEEMVERVRTATTQYLDKQRSNDETLREYLLHLLSEEDVQNIVDSINRSLSEQMKDKLADSSIGEQVAHLSVEHVVNKLSMSGGKELLVGIGGLLGGLGGAAATLLGGNLVVKFLGLLREPAEQLLASNINEMLRDNGHVIVGNIVDNEIDAFINKRVSDLLRAYGDHVERVPASVVSVYTAVIRDHLPKLLQSIDISRLVEERINEMDIVETEKLILQVMDKELKAIVWLGALLGAIMGSVNILLNI